MRHTGSCRAHIVIHDRLHRLPGSTLIYSIEIAFELALPDGIQCRAVDTTTLGIDVTHANWNRGEFAASSISIIRVCRSSTMMVWDREIEDSCQPMGNTCDQSRSRNPYPLAPLLSDPHFLLKFKLLLGSGCDIVEVHLIPFVEQFGAVLFTYTRAV